MLSLKNPLLRMASAQPQCGAFRTLLANMAREAGIQEDLFARASYIEGLLGAKPGSLARNPRASLAPVYKALEEGGGEDHLISILRDEHRMSDNDIALLVGMRDLDLFGALVQGATKGMPNGSSRGLTPQDVAMAIASGLSPLTLEPLKYGHGKNVFYYMGTKAHGKITMAGIIAILRAEAQNRAFDIVRGTSKGEGRSVSLYKPVGGDDTDAVLGDFIADESAVTSNIDLVWAIFNDPAILNVVDREVRKQLGGPVQVAVWTAIASDPSLIKPNGDEIGVEMRALAKLVAGLTGTEYNGKSSDVVAGRLFRDRVWPAFRNVIDQSDVAARLLKNRDIHQIIFDATHSHAHMAATKVDPRFASFQRRIFASAAAQHVAAQFLRTQ